MKLFYQRKKKLTKWNGLFETKLNPQTKWKKINLEALERDEPRSHQPLSLSLTLTHTHKNTHTQRSTVDWCTEIEFLPAMPPPDKPARRFSFFGLNSNASAAVSGGARVKTPQLKLEADREVYRPGDLITVTIEIKNTSSSWSLLIEKLNFEIKGIEKLDTQWFNTPKPSPDYRHRRGNFNRKFINSSSQFVLVGLCECYA